MEKRTTKYRMENIKYDFRLFLAGSLENASVEVLEIFYRRYMMAIDEDIYNTRYLPDFNWPHLENILNEFYRVKYFHESYFYWMEIYWVRRIGYHVLQKEHNLMFDSSYSSWV